MLSPFLLWDDDEWRAGLWGGSCQDLRECSMEAVESVRLKFSGDGCSKWY